MTKKLPAKFNRSTRLTEWEIENYSQSVITLNEKQTINSVTDKVINQDIFEAVEYLPDNFVDLLFIDPPYNLTKKFNDISFKEMKDAEYESWLDSWLSRMKILLKENSSIYICGDWKSSASIFNIGSKYFKVRNRITWEREKGRGAKTNWKNCCEDIWFFTNSNQFTFNVNDVKLRRKVLAHIKMKIETRKTGIRIFQEISEIHFHQISGMILQFLSGQCRKIQIIQLRNPKSFSQK